MKLSNIKNIISLKQNNPASPENFYEEAGLFEEYSNENESLEELNEENVSEEINVEEDPYSQLLKDLK